MLKKRIQTTNQDIDEAEIDNIIDNGQMTQVYGGQGYMRKVAEAKQQLTELEGEYSKHFNTNHLTRLFLIFRPTRRV